jgi:uncharacterized protein YkwD
VQAQPPRTYSSDTITTTTISTTENEQLLVEILNDVRIEAGLLPLKLTADLQTPASDHAEDMAEDDYFDHDSWNRSDGELVFEETWEERVLRHYQDSIAIGEVITAGYEDAESVLNVLLSLEGSREILLGPYREVGVGYARTEDSTYADYWTVDTGARHNVYPIVINAEAAMATSPVVDIHVYGEWDEVRFKNNGQAWDAWMDAPVDTNPIAWTLPEASATYTVCAEMRGCLGQVNSEACDQIRLHNSYELGSMPDTLEFTHYILEDATEPEERTVSPENVGGDASISLAFTSERDWIDVIPRRGETGESFTITLNEASLDELGIKTGVVNVEALEPHIVVGSPHMIDVVVHVVNAPQPEERVFLPVLLR